ncbi:MAG: hypothetical protein GWP24_05310 [Alphaproteobacteria bacterium]|nr:hypothetical protein [Alphaproteobacteria bacterium]
MRLAQTATDSGFLAPTPICVRGGVYYVWHRGGVLHGGGGWIGWGGEYSFRANTPPHMHAKKIPRQITGGGWMWSNSLGG